MDTRIPSAICASRYRLATELLNPLPMSFSALAFTPLTTLAAAVLSCVSPWKLCRNAPPMCSAKPVNGTVSALGGSNQFRPRWSAGRMRCTSIVRYSDGALAAWACLTLSVPAGVVAPVGPLTWAERAVAANSSAIGTRRTILWTDIVSPMEVGRTVGVQLVLLPLTSANGQVETHRHAVAHLHGAEHERRRGNSVFLHVQCV